jgi:hypothetical protein
MVTNHIFGQLTPCFGSQVWTSMGMVLVKAGGAIIEVDSSGCCTKTARAADKDKAVMQLVGGKEESVVNVTGHSTLGSNLNKVLCHASF